MTEVSRLKALLPNGAIEDVTISPSADPPWTLSFSGVGMLDQTFAGEDQFEALVALRKRLEGMGCRLLCAGARTDVWPSGMARSMGPARKAYVCEIGKPAYELVDIFDEALPEQVGSVNEQEQFNKTWIAALRAKMK